VASLLPNSLKMDLAGFRALGTLDSPLCAIQIAPVDWQTSQALNERLDSPSITDPDGQTVRERWGNPQAILERRSLPGMIVAHIILETSDHRLLVCQRQSIGIHDEAATWSLSIEERWSGSPQKARARPGGSRPDRTPHDLVRRGVWEELGVEVSDSSVLVLSWGLEASILYPGFMALVQVPHASWEIERSRGQADDANEIRAVTSIPADTRSLDLLTDESFQPDDRPWLRGRWHRTSRSRLFIALAHIASRYGINGRHQVLTDVGRL
jgi:hypothetical protein